MSPDFACILSIGNNLSQGNNPDSTVDAKSKVAMAF